MATHRIELSQIVTALLVVEDDMEATGDLPLVPISKLSSHIKEVESLGMRAVKLFVKSAHKTNEADDAINPNNLSVRAIKISKDASPNICVITDTCLCTYTTNGDCILQSNDGSLCWTRSFDVLAQQALLQVEAGADIIGPATMAVGSIAAIRAALDAAGTNTPIMPHLTLRSALYRNYRSEMNTGNGIQRQVFQIDPVRVEHYVEMGRQFLKEGADILMMQPSLFSFDLIKTVKEQTGAMTGIFSTSGEYIMMNGSPGGIDLFLEHASAAIRAGADFLVTYAGVELAKKLLQRNSPHQQAPYQ
jgi:porphobilinogen synthase